MPKSSDFTRDDFRKKFSDALKTNDEEKVAEVFCSFAEEMRKGIENDYLEYQKTKDNAILEKRGVRTLTADETKFYKELIKAAREDSIEKGFEGLENAFPETVIDQVLDDIKTIFPLLGAISIQNTATLTKMIVNKKGVQFAVWGPLGSKITQELDGAIAKVEVGTKKLTAFMVISKDMMDAGPQWIDAYVRAVLAEALGAGLCKAIIAGTGKNEPIGMMKNPDGSVTEGVYPDKEAVKITDLSPKTIGSIAKTISKGPNNRKRAVPRLLMAVNPTDYFDKVMPATTYLTPNGTYVQNVMPYPTDIVQDVNVPDGKAIFGLASRYFMGVGKGGAGGKVEYSDEVRFLDDERVYITKMYGDGMPLDGNAFVVADIFGLEPANYEVTVRQKETAAS